MIRVFYTRGKGNIKIEKAAFANESDALIFWTALSEKRKEYLTIEIDGKPIVEFRHTGFNSAYGQYGHADALTTAPDDNTRSRQTQVGFEFDPVRKDK